MAPQWNILEKRFHFLKVEPFFPYILIIMFGKKNSASDQSDTICHNGLHSGAVFQRNVENGTSF